MGKRKYIDIYEVNWDNDNDLLHRKAVHATTSCFWVSAKRRGKQVLVRKSFRTHRCHCFLDKQEALNYLRFKTECRISTVEETLAWLRKLLAKLIRDGADSEPVRAGYHAGMRDIILESQCERVD